MNDMKTLLYTHPAFLKHDPGPGHPECPARLTAVLKALEHPDFQGLERREAPMGTYEQACLVHDPDYVDLILDNVPQSGYVQLDPDTIMSPGSGEAIMRGIGATCAAVDAVLAGEADNAFCAVRPCGHHAERNRAMGFCLFNQLAVAAVHARTVHGLERVALVDFDVHHGNGTQHMFENEPGLFYASTHQAPFYPGTGARSERGRGNIVNVPLPRGAGSREFREGFENEILPALEAFDPQIILVSAGFDAHQADPLAGLNLTEADYAWATRKLMTVADAHCGGKIVSMLEGGYSLDATARSTADHIRALMGQ